MPSRIQMAGLNGWVNKCRSVAVLRESVDATREHTVVTVVEQVPVDRL